MADEEGMQDFGWAAQTGGGIGDDIKWDVPDVVDINPKAYSKYPLDRFVKAAKEGDLELLEKLLDREDPINGFHQDINMHFNDANALHAAAANGQLEAVEMLLNARADPHVKVSVPHGKDPKNGETARELADKWGWDDIVEVLKKAESETPKGLYMSYGTGNNAKLWPVDKPQGLDYEQEKRAMKKYKGLVRPLPKKAERKFYGDLVFGVTHGYDDNGKVIKSSQFAAQQIQEDEEFDTRVAIGEEIEDSKPKSHMGLMFPGQGSQYVKMMSGFREDSKVKEMAATAQKVLGFDLMEICLKGPEEKLESMEVTQPAIVLASLAGMEKLKVEYPEAASNPGALAGLSVGEYTALVVAGVLDFESVLHILKARSAAMKEAAAVVPQAMLSVAGLAKETLADLCAQVRKETSEVCEVSNMLFPKGCTCAGTKASIMKLKDLADKSGAIQTKVLKMEGAFHTSLMEPARGKLEAALKEFLPKMKPPTTDIYMNTSGKRVAAGSDPSVIIEHLCNQLVTPVLWEDSIRGMVGAGITHFFEVGPLKQLRSMMKRIDQSSWSNAVGVDV